MMLLTERSSIEIQQQEVLPLSHLRRTHARYKLKSANCTLTTQEEESMTDVFLLPFYLPMWTTSRGLNLALTFIAWPCDIV